jgi:hypothetical protein
VLMSVQQTDKRSAFEFWSSIALIRFMHDFFWFSSVSFLSTQRSDTAHLWSIAVISTLFRKVFIAFIFSMIYSAIAIVNNIEICFIFPRIREMVCSFTLMSSMFFFSFSDKHPNL